MSRSLRPTPMTGEDFLDWAGEQEERYEFDGFEPVAMTGGSVNHSTIMLNLAFLLKAKLAGTPCRPLGPDVGVPTVNGAIRYPDVLIVCGPLTGTARLVQGPVIVFEVLSPTSGRRDRIVKSREYGAVASIRRYVMIETIGIGATSFERAVAEQPWMAKPLMAGEAIDLLEVGIVVDLDALYDGVEWPDAASRREEE